MNRKSVIEQVIQMLEENLDSLIGSSQEASDSANHEETRAKSKWDTQSIEASYLAAGHATKANKLLQEIQSLHGMLVEFKQSGNQLGVGSVIKCDLAGSEEYFLLSASGGGLETSLEGNSITVVSPSTPLGQSLISSHVGDTVTLLNGAKLLVVDSVF